MAIKKVKEVLKDKIEMLCLIFFILGIFLFDVSLNLISYYGVTVSAPIVQSKLVNSSSAFWLGYLVSCVCFLIVSIRSHYKKKENLKNFDIFFSIIGTIGLAIMLAGGLLIFTGKIGEDLLIPFFSWNIPRVNFYHFGLTLDIIALLYFALTK